MTEDGGGIWRKDKIIIFEYCGIYMPLCDKAHGDFATHEG